MLNRDYIAFRKGFVINDDVLVVNPSQEAYTLQAELMRLGYMIKNIDTISKERAVELYNNIIPNLKSLLGDGDYKPLYSGFPKQVMEMTDFELFVDQIMHYMSNGTWKPCDYMGEIPTLFERVDYTIIESGDNIRFENIFTDLVSLNNSLSPFDTEVVEWFAENDILNLPQEIPFKETLCKLASLNVPNLPIKTTTDVLRIAVHMSGGDISLPAIPKSGDKSEFKFKKFTRAERRYILSLLENSNCDVTEMKLKVNRWIRLGEIIHPAQYSNRYPRAAKAFKLLRNNIKDVKTFNSRLMPLIKWYEDEKTVEEGLKLLSIRPGEFGRRLDYLVRTHDYKMVLKYFTETATNISNKVLFEMYNHFVKRDSGDDRFVTIKGKKNPIKLKKLDVLPTHVLEEVKKAILDAIFVNMKSKEPMKGAYYIDPRLKSLPIPTNMRSISDGLLAVPRGAKIPLNTNANCVRFYTHWVDKNGTEDLDLAAFLMSSDGTKKVSIAWNGYLKDTYGCHSGDVRCVVGNCAEYVDILTDKALADGFRYVVMSVSNYNGRSLKSVSPTIGWMEREFPESNLTWTPSTVKNSILLDSMAKSSTVAIIDLSERCVIYVDETTQRNYTSPHDSKYELELIKRYTNTTYLSVYDVLEMNILARGGITTDEQTFEVDEDGEITVWEYPCFYLEEFLSDYTEILKYMI